MNECIFCAIVKKIVKSRVVHEDDTAVAVLDITPKSKGMCLVIPKKHFEFSDQDVETSVKTFKSALVVAQKIKIALNPLTIFFASMQAQVPHFNIRVYPVYENQIPLVENRPIETNDKEMDEIAKKIKGVGISSSEEIQNEEVVEEEPEEVIEVEKEVVNNEEEDKKVDKEKEDKKFWFKKSFETA